MSDTAKLIEELRSPVPGNPQVRYRAADALIALQEDVERLTRENAALCDRNADVNMRAFKWMERHDRVAAGKDGGPFPKPADLPESIGRATAAEATVERLREALAAGDAELKRLMLAYVNLLESGRDRIVFLGGTCDPVDVMEAGDPSLRRAKDFLATRSLSQAGERT